MAGGHLRRTALVATLVLGVFAAPAHALTPAQAKKAALAALHPEREHGRVIVFGLQAPIAKGSSVFEAGAAAAPKSGHVRISVAPLAAPAWLFWEDLDYGARFQHPSRLVLVDDRTGKATVTRRKLRWYPVVDGKPPAFLGAGYRRAEYRVWSNVPGAPARRTSGVARSSAPPSAIPKKAFADDCVVMIGLRDDPQFAQDFAGVNAEAHRLGIRAFVVNSGDKNADPDGKSLAAAVSQIVAAPTRCKDVMIYMSAHGYETGPTAVHVGMKWRKDGPPRNGKQLWLGTSADVTADDLSQIMHDHPKTTFKLVIDACFSGRFILDLPRSLHPNLLVLATAARADEESYSYLDQVELTNGRKVRNDTNNPGNANPDGQGRGEFTNGLLAGIDDFAGSKAEVAKAQKAGGSLLAHMIERALALGINQDFAARWKLMKPLVSSAASPGERPAGPVAAPKVDPIRAVFVQAEFATDYSVHAADPAGHPLTYRWTLDPPRVDPHCNNLGHTTGTGRTFQWKHGDQHGCDHRKEGPAGHQGVVHVAVSNGVWVCKASYAGTNTGVGAEKPTCSKA